MCTITGTAIDQPNTTCVPFVSEYSDCIDENQCSGCSKCTCSASGTWSCVKINKCSDGLSRPPMNERDLDMALLMMESDMRQQRKEKARASRNPFVPPPTTEQSLLLEHGTERKLTIEEDIMELLRPKRSIEKPKDDKNNTIKFYHTVDELNEDTLKNTNDSGTLKARKLDVDLPKLSRRAGGLLADNTSNPLHIEYNKADIYQHINDNKIDVPHHEQDIHNLLANYSQKQKDREISKVIVKEMKSGTEIIGDRTAPIMSNVSFAPENETFVAMTYIAGNLLNKLWNMETESSETIETEVLKHEKIAELLDLFKEPLSMNQEMLLKNAMEQLSIAIDKNKNIQNVSLCEQLGEAKEFLNRNVSQEKKSECDKDKKKDTEVIGNVNKVVDLVSKLESIQSSMNALKDSNKHVQPKDLKGHEELSRFIKKSDSPINMFAGILEQMAKLLLPAKSGKRFSSKLRNLGMFGKDYDLKNRFKNIFNIALGNITMTTKDKIILDYLTHIEKSPDCLLHGKKSKVRPTTPPNIERNILLNLSEFFKMKSLTDLVQLLGPEIKVNKSKIEDASPSLLRTSVTTESVTDAFTTVHLATNDANKLTATKEKLKAHLKTILEDLVELQNAKGVSKNTDIKLTDVLPCIYNILNADKASNDQIERDNPEDKLSSIFSNLKRELKYASYRRSNIVMERPKSAIVWERVVKNLNDKQKSTRRIMNEVPIKSLNELKKLMEDVESHSNTYKNIAFLTNVPSADKLTLLKTLDVDVKKYIKTLEDIKKSLEAGVIPRDKMTEFNEFVDNVANNMNINEKVIKKINKPKVRPNVAENYERFKPKLSRPYSLAEKPEFTLPKDTVDFNTKITRDQIINQLIKNRINLYIRIKEARGTDLSDDINYDIARKILMYLDSGNNALARELYNIFANRQMKNDGVQNVNAGSTQININKYSGPTGMLNKEPLIQFEDQKTRRVNIPSQNHLIQQLINMKNMGI